MIERLWSFIIHYQFSIIHCQTSIARRLLIRHSPGDPAELGSENSCACDEPRTKPPCRSHGAERDRGGMLSLYAA